MTWTDTYVFYLYKDTKANERLDNNKDDTIF